MLGPIAVSRITHDRDANGLVLRYEDLVRRAFQPAWWDSPAKVTLNGGKFSQQEANFSMFWGLSMKAYLESLVANDTRVDRFFDGDRNALTALEKRGLNLFQSFKGEAPDPVNPGKTITVKLANGQPADTRCTSCHGGPETTTASISNVQDQRLERMVLKNGTCAIYDQGFLNTGVRPSADDFNLAALDPFNNSFSQTRLPLEHSLERLVPTAGPPPFGLDQSDDPNNPGPGLGQTKNGESPTIAVAFKVPQLRNVELTGPYFHNGGQLTLMQVMDFYNRGGDFNNPDLDENIQQLHLSQADERALVAFMLALTDDRVAYERAPFDHPEHLRSERRAKSLKHIREAR